MHLIKSVLKILNARERKRFFALVFYNVVISLADIASLALLVFVVGFYTQQLSADAISLIPGWLANRQSVLLILALFLLIIIKNFLGFLIFRLQYHFVYGVATRLSERNLLYYFEGNYQEYVNIDSAVHASAISIQPVEFCQFVLGGIQQVASELILIVLVVISIAWYDAKLFLLLLLFLAPSVLIASWFLKKGLMNIRKRIKSSREAMWQYLQEAIAGFIEIKIYGKSDFFANRYTSKQEILNKYLAGMHTLQGIPARLFEVFAIFGLLVLIFIAGLSGNETGIGFITLGAFIAAAYKIIPGVVKIINLSGQIRTFQFTVQELLQTRSPSDKGGAEGTGQELRSIELNNVSFSYNGEGGIEDFNLKITSGEMAGLTGMSGIGKTTLANMLLGFLEKRKGVILVNGKEATSNDMALLRGRVAYVKQQPFLIHDTVLRNIILDDKSYDEERLQTALTATGLDKAFEPGKNVGEILITENGKNISGGQRKRIALARALYKDADLIVLDEPFSELDTDSEKVLMEHLKTLATGGRMVLLITHNRSSLDYCDRTYTMVK